MSPTGEGGREGHEVRRFIKILRMPDGRFDGPPPSFNEDDEGWTYTIGLEDENGNSLGGLITEGSKTREEAEARAKKLWGEGLEVRFEDLEKFGDAK